MKFEWAFLCLWGLYFTGMVWTEDLSWDPSDTNWDCSLWFEGDFVALSLALDELLSLIGDLGMFFEMESF